MNVITDDSTARLQALDPQQSFIVSAPAGSGKTGLITQRVLRLLCTVEQPEQILCITFTRKAAGEMAVRIHEALHQAANSPRPEDQYQAQTWDLAAAAVERSNQLGWNLTAMPGRLRIQTIDGFCRYIASQFALETEIGVLPEPSENPQVHYQAAARNLLADLEQNSDTGRHLGVLLAHTGNNLERCEQLLSELLGKREQWLPLIFQAANNQSYFQAVVEQLVGETLMDLESALQPIAGELVELADFAASHVPAEKNSPLVQLQGLVELPDHSFYGLAQWKALLGLLVTKDRKPRKTLTVAEGFPASEKPTKARMLSLLDWSRNNAGLQEQISNALFLPETDLTEAQQDILNALGYLLPLLVAKLDIIFQQQEQCDYPAITLAALQALEQSPDDGAISDITMRLDYSLRHILVDEFQDTSSSQIQLLERLLAGWEPDDGRTLFLVGDAMQSLYSFRNANVGLFLQAQQQPVGPVQCQPLSLSTNFRSRLGIIDWVNQTFNDAFPAQADISRGAIPYSHSVAHKDAGSDRAVEFYGFSCEDKQDYDQIEAEQVAASCADIQSQSPGQSIAILVRGRGHLKEIIPALGRANLSWQAIDINPLKTVMPVMDMLSLTRALLSPADRIAWLAVLRAPFCGLDLGDLLAITNSLETSGKQPMAILHRLQQLDRERDIALSDYARHRLQSAIPALLQAWQSRGRLSLRNCVEQLWVKLGGPATLHSSTDLNDVRSYLDLLEDWQVAGTVKDWDGFQQAADKLFAAPNAGEAERPSIQIMTIHKSKGLEFDHVLLPGLCKTPKSGDRQLLRWQQHMDQQGQQSLIMAPLGAHDEEDDSIYRYLKYEDNVKTGLENTRVLYVAATRAVHKLYLFGQLKPSKTGWQSPGKTTLLGPIWKGVEADITAGTYVVNQVPANNQGVTQQAGLRHKRRLAAGFSVAYAPVPTLSTGAEGNRKSEAQAQSDSPISSRAKHLGTCIHRTLKQIANEGVPAWSAERLQRLPLTWSAQLKELGLLASEQELRNMGQAISHMLADPKGLWILHHHTQAACEQMLGYSPSVAGHGGVSIVDRTFVEDGVRWVIDYKFAAPETGEQTRDFVRRQIASYQAQLRHYANLYRHMEQLPVRCALYFPQIPLFVEVAAD